MKEKMKILMGIYSASLVLMGLIVPVSVLANIAQSFPDVPITTIQLMVTLPSLLAIPSGLVVSKLAYKFYKKHVAIFFTVLYMISGILPVFFHDNMYQLLFSAAMVGVSMGGLQNPMTTIIPDYFDGESRGIVLGLLSTFICFGGMIYTQVASRLGASDWTKAFYAYGIMIIFLVGEIVFMPKGKLEEKPTKGNHAKVPGEVIWLCVMGFVFYTCYQVFNSNEALLIVERQLGGTIEAGYASAACTGAGILAGVIVGPWLKMFKKHSITATFATTCIGLVLCVVSQNIILLCVGGFITALGYQTFTPIAGMKASEASELMGMAFNMALVNALCSCGQALSPFTTSALTTPWGHSLTSLFILGTVGCAVITVLAFVHFSGTKKEA